MGRCKSTNLCPYCARLFAVETSELLLLDAEQDAPQLYVVLTARELLERADCRDHLRQLRRSLKRRWPSIEWAVLVEFQRRGALHLNLLVKGVPTGDAGELHDRCCRIWCKRVDAEPAAQFVGEVSDGPGLVRYISLHFLKPAQAPPIGWRGHRVSYTAGYLVAPASTMRRRARESLRLKRELWKASQVHDNAHDVELTAQLAVRQAARSVWVLATDRGARLSDTTYDPRRLIVKGGDTDGRTTTRPPSPAGSPPPGAALPRLRTPLARDLGAGIANPPAPKLGRGP
jgi:hypothetical protein